MTPTEQDSNGDEILKQRIYEEIAVIFAGKDLSHEQIASLMDDRKESVELIMRLITADRKRVAVEARIDEINYLDDNFQTDSQDWEREHPGYSTAMIPMEDYIRRRTELKAQQEEV